MLEARRMMKVEKKRSDEWRGRKDAGRRERQDEPWTEEEDEQKIPATSSSSSGCFMG